MKRGRRKYSGLNKALKDMGCKPITKKVGDAIMEMAKAVALEHEEKPKPSEEKLQDLAEVINRAFASKEHKDTERPTWREFELLAKHVIRLEKQMETHGHGYVPEPLIGG